MARRGKVETMIALAILITLSSLVTQPIAAPTDSCNGRCDLHQVNAQNYYQIGEIVRVEVVLGAGFIVNGTHLGVNRVRFELDCTTPGVPCPDAGNLFSYIGNISSTCAGSTWAAGSAGGTLPNEIVFTATPPVEIPARHDEFCSLQFDVEVEALPPVGTTILQAAGFTIPQNDAVCNTPGLLPAGAMSFADFRICNCDDGNACTIEFCDPQLGCIYTPVVCDDGNACTSESCNPADGCLFTPFHCGDDSACTIDGCDPQLGCTYTPRACDDDNPCTDDSCAVSTGCVYAPNTAPCDDHLACTEGDSCMGGACTSTPKDCDDANLCTLDTCVEPDGVCSHAAPSGQCNILGTVRYYRDPASLAEPSLKPVSGQRILRTSSVEGPAVAITNPGGQYEFSSEAGDIQLTPQPHLMVDESECRAAITAQDAGMIAKAVVQRTMLSPNQTRAGDVTGNGRLSAYDAALTAIKGSALSCLNQAVPISVVTGSDWALLPQSKSFTPLVGGEDYDFVGVLYGDVTGNWGSGPLAGGSTEVLDEAVPQFARAMSSIPTLQRSVDAVETRARNEASAGADLYLSQGPALRPDGLWTLTLGIRNADGILGLDLDLRFDSSLAQVKGVEVTGIATADGLISNDVGGAYRISIYGVSPLQGSGAFLVVTYDQADSTIRFPFGIAAEANEGQIPVSTSDVVLRPGSHRPTVQADPQ